MDIGEVESVDDLLLAFFSVSRKEEEAGANSEFLYINNV